MKVLTVLVPFLILTSAYASEQILVQCKVAKVVNTSFLEESLSVEEYPDVEITQDETGAIKAWLGASLFDNDEGDDIRSQNTVGFDTIYKITPSYNLDQYSIVVTGRPSSRTGKLLGRGRNDENQEYGDWVLIANLNCK